MLANYSYLFLKYIVPTEIISIPNIQKMYIGDKQYSKAYNIDFRPMLCFVFDLKGEYIPSKKKYKNILTGPEIFYKKLEELRNREDYIADYKYDFGEDLHVVLFEVPVKWQKAVTHFLNSEYSKIYTINELKRFGMDRNDDIYKILTKDPSRIPFFEKSLNTIYGTSIKVEDDRELLLPIDIDKEVLNSSYVSKTIN